jgi:hypothetical protein
MSDPVEIGKVSKIEADQLYLWHTQGEALQEARMLKAMMERYAMTQKELAKFLRVEMNIEILQPQISRLLSLLGLEPVFIEMLEGKRMAHSTGIRLAKLPSGSRMKILDKIKAEDRDNIYLYDVVDERRNIVITSDLVDLAMEYDEGLDDPVYNEADLWWNSLSPFDKDKVFQLNKRG